MVKTGRMIQRLPQGPSFEAFEHLISRKGANGVGTNGVTADFMFSDRGTCCVPVCQNLTIVLTFFPKNMSKCITFAATPYNNDNH